jgi:hypothetical protein
MKYDHVGPVERHIDRLYRVKGKEHLPMGGVNVNHPQKGKCPERLGEYLYRNFLDKAHDL